MATQLTMNARSAVAATATSASTSRVYFQDTQNGIREAIYDNGKWTISDAVLFTAKRSTPLAVISLDEGKQVSCSLSNFYSNKELTRRHRSESTVCLQMACCKSGVVAMEIGSSQTFTFSLHQTPLSLP